MPKGSNRIPVGQTNLAILRGQEDVRDWDDEELLRGQRRNINGQWSGRPPKIVPKAVHDELVRRTYSRAQQEITTSLERAVATMTGLLSDPDSAVRFNAAKFLIDRVMGKTPERVNVDFAVKAKWETALDAAVVTVAQLPIDAFATDDDDDPFKS